MRASIEQVSVGPGPHQEEQQRVMVPEGLYPARPRRGPKKPNAPSAAQKQPRERFFCPSSPEKPSFPEKYTFPDQREEIYMRIWRLAALSLAAVLTAGMLTGCPWDKDDAASSDLPGSSSGSTSQPSSDDEDDDTPAPPAKHTVTINGEEVAITANGKAQDIELSGDSGKTEGTLTVTITPDNKVTATIKPESGFAIKSINGKPVPSDKRKEYTVSDLNLDEFTSASGDVAIDFAELQTVTITTSDENKGEVTVSSNEVIEDDTLTVTVNANDGYVIESVTVGSDNHTPKTDEEKEKMTISYTVPKVSAKARSANEIQVSAAFAEEMESYTFTASVNTNGQDAPTRCYMQVCTANTFRNVIAGSIQNGQWTFSNVSLQPDQSYTYLFWADTATGTAPDDLRNISYTFDTAAYAASTSGTPESVSQNTSITLTPVTTKITLQNTATNFTPDSGEQFTITLSCAETYNVETESATGNAQHTYTHTFGPASTAVTQLLDALTNDGVCSFYALDPGTDVTIGFRDFELETTLSQAGVLSVDLSDTSNW